MTFALLCVAFLAPPENGAGRDDSFRYPLACAAGGDGGVYVVDRRLPGVWRVTGSADGPARATVFKAGGTVFRTPLNAPRCVAFAPASKRFPKGSVLVGDSATRTIYRLDPTADEPAAEPLWTGDADAGPIGVPSAVAVGPDGVVFAADLESQRIFRIPPDGAAAAIATLPGVRGLCATADGDLLAITTEKNAVRRFVPGPDGDWSEAVAVAGPPFRSPQAAALGPDGSLFVADNAAGGLWKLAPTADGGFAAPVPFAIGAPLVGPTGVCLDASTDPPRLIVVDPKVRALFAVRLEDGTVTPLAP